MDIQATNDIYDWVGVSTLATQLCVSKQTIYNRIKKGVYPTRNFARGTMNGILVGIIKQSTNGL